MGLTVTSIQNLFWLRKCLSVSSFWDNIKSETSRFVANVATVAFPDKGEVIPPSLPGVGWAGIKTWQKSCFYRIHTGLDASVALVVFFLSQRLPHPLHGGRPCNSSLSPLSWFLAFYFSSTSCLIQYLLRRQASDPFILFFLQYITT